MNSPCSGGRPSTGTWPVARVQNVQVAVVPGFLFAARGMPASSSCRAHWRARLRKLVDVQACGLVEQSGQGVGEDRAGHDGVHVAQAGREGGGGIDGERAVGHGPGDRRVPGRRGSGGQDGRTGRQVRVRAQGSGSSAASTAAARPRLSLSSACRCVACSVSASIRPPRRACVTRPCWHRSGPGSTPRGSGSPAGRQTPTDQLHRSVARGFFAIHALRVSAPAERERAFRCRTPQHPTGRRSRAARPSGPPHRGSDQRVIAAA